MSIRSPNRLLSVTQLSEAYPRELLADFTNGDFTLVTPDGGIIVHKNPKILTFKMGSYSKAVDPGDKQDVVLPTFSLTIGDSTKTITDFDPEGGEIKQSWTLAEIGAMAADGSEPISGDLVPKDGETVNIGSTTNHFHTAYIDNVVGNADTATKLKTPINFKIGETTKKFDGSSDISWTLSEIGVFASDGSSDMTGDITPSVDNEFNIGSTTKRFHTIYATEFTGNAATASKLAKEVTLTVGKCARKFDGSKDVTWPLADCGFLAADGSVPLMGDLVPGEASVTIGSADHPLTGIFVNDIYGNIETATKLANVVNIRIGNVTKQWDGSFDLSWLLEEMGALGHAGDVPITGTLKPFINKSINLGTGDNMFKTIYSETFQGNATTASKLNEAVKLTVGNCEKEFDGSEDITWTLSDIGAMAADGSQPITGDIIPADGEEVNIGSTTNVFKTIYGDTFTGNAATASKLKDPFDLTIGKTKKSIDGSQAVTWTLAEIGAMPADGSGSITGDFKPETNNTINLGDSTHIFNTIYGTTFTGNAATADKWKVERKFTVGKCERMVDGTKDINWTLEDIGAMPASGGSIGNILPDDDGGDIGSAAKPFNNIYVTNVHGNATSADAWKTARTLTVNSDASGSVSIKGDADVTLSLTVITMTGATASAAGKKGFVPAPAAGANTKFLRGDATWQTIPLPSVMTGASALNDGASGLVPKPTQANKVGNQFLCADGTWTDITGLFPSIPGVMTAASASAAGSSGLVPQPAVGANTKFLRGDATWQTIPLPSNMTAASASAAGAAGLVPAPAAGAQGKFLRGDATWQTITIPGTMTGASASAAGAAGLVPQPAAGANTKFLRGDGTWQTLSLGVMTGATASTAGTSGTVPAPAAGAEGLFLRGDGVWATPTDNNNKVTQTVTSTNAEYPLLFKESTAVATITSTARFASAITVNPSTGTITATTFKGNASTASKLGTARTIKLTSAVTGSGSFDGSGDLSITTTLANSGMTAGTYSHYSLYPARPTADNNNFSNAIFPSVSGIHNGTSTLTWTARAAGTISFSYICTGESGCDYFTFTNNGTAAVSNFVTASHVPTIQSYSGAVVANAALVFTYRKDVSVSKFLDSCVVYNIQWTPSGGSAVNITAANVDTYFITSAGAQSFGFMAARDVHDPVITYNAKGLATGVVNRHYVRNAVTCGTVSTSWSGSASAGYTQVITVPGVFPGCRIAVDVIWSETFATDVTANTNFAKIYRFAITAQNQITAYATAATTAQFVIAVYIL